MGDGWRDVTPYKRSLAEKMTYEQRSEGKKKKRKKHNMEKSAGRGFQPQEIRVQRPWGRFTHLREGQRGERRVARAVAIG